MTTFSKIQNPDCVLLDCTLRDGGYYVNWDFSSSLIEAYLVAMRAAQVDYVELGFRFLENDSFKGACAYTSDWFLDTLSVPDGLFLAVMVNASDLCSEIGCLDVVSKLFPRLANETLLNLVRIACHPHEIRKILPAIVYLHDFGYKVAINLMQIESYAYQEVLDISSLLRDYPIDVLYVADSLGSMSPCGLARIISWFRQRWKGDLGIHAHDNMGSALANTLRAHAEGVSWLDSTVTGMGRGPGNARTEELIIEAEIFRNRRSNLIPLMEIIRNSFSPMKAKYSWGTNPYYYLAGKHSIHPSYIQEMMRDPRYADEDILAVIDYLRDNNGRQFHFDYLESARNFYDRKPCGNWHPASLMKGKEVLILGAGPSVLSHVAALEDYVTREHPLVIALNTQSALNADLINLRIACHPVRLLADAHEYSQLPQPLIAPVSMLPERLSIEFQSHELLDFGLAIKPGRFEFHDNHCVIPCSLVLAYALAVITSGKCSRALMAGFDGYEQGDPRNVEVEGMISIFKKSNATMSLLSITPTTYRNISTRSLYGL